MIPEETKYQVWSEYHEYMVEQGQTPLSYEEYMKMWDSVILEEPSA